MNVLVVHNFYQQSGGEDQVFEAEVNELRRAGVNVTTYTVSNEVIDDASRLRVAAQTIWNSGVARELAAIVSREAVDVVHFHNTFPLISPAAYRAVRARGAAVVQTLHNYRLTCANGVLYRDGHVCTACVGRTVPTPAVRHACYRGSRAGSAVVASMLTTHRLLGTYERHVDRYVALTPDARDRMIEAGLPADRLAVKPNFLADDPGVRPHRGGYALYVGRLTPEKGLRTLLSAWRELGSDLPLRIVGTGPLAEEVAATAAATPGVQYLGVQDRERVFELMGEADLLVFPSEWYETFGLTIIEAYAVGLPVVASDLGSPRSLVHHDRTGRLFRAGDPDDLVKQIRALLNRPEDLRRMRPAARQEFEALYSREAALHQLLAVYEDAMIRRRGPSARSTVRSA